MDRPEEILKKISLLLDKPISPIVTREIKQLLLNEGNPIQKCIHLLCMKYRCDLLIYLHENNRMPNSIVLVKTILKSIRTNILEYKKDEVVKLYLLILSQITNEKEQLEIGYSNIIELVLKKPNLQTKEVLLWVLCQNLAYFFSIKRKRIVVAICTNYIQIFNKMLMYVNSFVKFINVILDIDHKSKQVFAKEHPEKQQKLEEIFLDLTSRELSLIKTQIINILTKTKQKLNQYGLHRECFKGLQKIGQSLNKFKIKQTSLYFTEIDIGQIVRVIENFIGRKGVIDQAKSCKAQWIKRVALLQTQKVLKTQKMLIPLPKKQEQPYIEDVISLTNNYRLKYEAQPEYGNRSSIVLQKNYLKKKNGIGGGRTFQLEHNNKNKQKRQSTKVESPSKIRSLVDRCFNHYEKDLEYRSYPEPEIDLPKIPEITQQTQKIPESFHQTNFMQRSEMQNSKMSLGSRLQDDQDVEEISNLIDLAYNYKFS